MLNAKNVGATSEVTISKADLMRPESLKILSEARAGDVTKNYDASGALVSLTVRRKTPLTVQTAADGGISLNCMGDVYLANAKGRPLFNPSFAGDKTRRAVGWRDAAEVGSLFATYWRRYDSPDAGPFIDLRPWELTLAEMVQSKGTEETVTISEDA